MFCHSSLLWARIISSMIQIYLKHLYYNKNIRADFCIIWELGVKISQLFSPPSIRYMHT